MPHTIFSNHRLYNILDNFFSKLACRNNNNEDIFLEFIFLFTVKSVVTGVNPIVIKMTKVNFLNLYFSGIFTQKITR